MKSRKFDEKYERKKIEDSNNALLQQKLEIAIEELKSKVKLLDENKENQNKELKNLNFTIKEKEDIFEKEIAFNLVHLNKNLEDLENKVKEQHDEIVGKDSIISEFEIRLEKMDRKQTKDSCNSLASELELASKLMKGQNIV